MRWCVLKLNSTFLRGSVGFLSVGFGFFCWARESWFKRYVVIRKCDIWFYWLYVTLVSCSNFMKYLNDFVCLFIHLDTVWQNAFAIKRPAGTIEIRMEGIHTVSWGKGKGEWRGIQSTVYNERIKLKWKAKRLRANHVSSGAVKLKLP